MLGLVNQVVYRNCLWGPTWLHISLIFCLSLIHLSTIFMCLLLVSPLSPTSWTHKHISTPLCRAQATKHEEDKNAWNLGPRNYATIKLHCPYFTLGLGLIRRGNSKYRYTMNTDYNLLSNRPWLVPKYHQQWGAHAPWECQRWLWLWSAFALAAFSTRLASFSAWVSLKSTESYSQTSCLPQFAAVE